MRIGKLYGKMGDYMGKLDILQEKRCPIVS